MSIVVGRDSLINALFFLFLGMVGGFIGSGIMSCGIQKMIIEGIYIKHVIFFILIYFAIGFVDSSTANPFNILLSTVLVYTIFMVIMKSQKEYVLLAVFLLGSLYVVSKIRETTDITDITGLENLDRISDILTVAAFLIVGVGFVIYFRRQYMEHRQDFDIQKFFFGTNKCDNVKG
jgi:hypothetical protein